MYLVMSLVETRGIDRIRSGTVSIAVFFCDVALIALPSFCLLLNVYS